METIDYLRRLCSMREYCRKEIMEKALRRLQSRSAGRGSDPACPAEDAAGRSAADLRSTAASMVETLVGEGFIDENRYATAFCRDKSSIRGWGPAKIRAALRSKGIPSDIIEDALQQIDASKADDKLSKALDVKIRQLKGDPAIRAKLLRFGLSRGYDYEQIISKISEKLEKNS